MEPLIAIENVSVVYGTGGTRATALDRLSLTVPAGEYLVITGESGAGKSTLLSLLGALQPPTEGRIFFGRTDVGALAPDRLADFRKGNIGFVFQAYHLLPYLTARENVMVPLAPDRLPAREKSRRAEELLASVGLSGKEGRLPSQLSGGECQRVAVARALAHDPPVLLADEPTGNLDSATGEQVLDLFDRLHGGGKTILVVTHNRAIRERGSRAVHLRDGRVEEDRPMVPRKGGAIPRALPA